MENPTGKQQYELEFVMNTSRAILYKQLSTPDGLSEWFADDVNLENDELFTFVWEGAEEKARLLSSKKDEHIRFRWEEDEEGEAYFQFRIQVDPLTQEVALIITDFAEDEEVEESKELWTSQVNELRQLIGA